MESFKNLSKEILLGADFANTIGGGMSLPKIDLSFTEEKYMAIISVPGVNIKKIKTDIINNRLLVYHLLNLTNDDELKSPHIIANFPIAQDVDVEQISANYNETKLVITAIRKDVSEGYEF